MTTDSSYPVFVASLLCVIRNHNVKAFAHEACIGLQSFAHHGRIDTTVPSLTAAYSARISSSSRATQPQVQSFPEPPP